MKIAIDNPIRNISPNIASHRSAWAYLWREMLIEDGHEVRVLHDSEDWDAGYDLIAIYWGMEWNGSPNMFDGLSPAVFERMDRFVRYHGKIPFVNLDVDIGDLFLRRMRSRVTNQNKTTDPRATHEWIESLFAALNGNDKWTQDGLKVRSGIVVGDSHSLSSWKPGHYCKRMDGKTLRGLTKTLVDDIAPFDMSSHGGLGNLDRISVNAGNIDIRHHLLRPREGWADWRAYLDDTLSKLVEAIKRTEIPEVELTHALPIEDESRYLRQSVCLEGSKFTGSWAERWAVMEHFNDRIDEVAAAEGWSVHRWPDDWYARTKEDPKWFFEVMEKPYSVHLSRQHYRWKTTPQDPPRPGVKASQRVGGRAKAQPEASTVDVWE